MDFKFTPKEEALRKEFSDLFKEEMKNAPPEWGTAMESMLSRDACAKFHRQMAKKLGEKRWLSRPWPTEYVGQDAPLTEQFIFSEVIGYYKGAGFDHWGVSLLAPTLLVSANDEQKKEHLPYIARGERFWTQLWSEPGAGSDLASLTTRATREGDDYVVSGQKTWTTGAHRADWGFLLARTNPAERRSRGLSFFLVDLKSPGITIKPILSLEGSHMFNEVFLDNVRIPARNRVGEENEGWVASQMTSNFERSMIELFSLLKRDFEDLVEFSKKPTKGGDIPVNNPLVRNKLAQLALEIDVGRAMSYFILWSQIKGGLVVAAPMACAAKVYGTELMQRLIYAGCQIMGLYGQVGESRWSPLKGLYEREYQLCVGSNIAGGSSEIMRNIICSMGLGLPRSW